MSHVVLLDANIIHALPVCAAILDFSELGLFQVRWTELILEEARRSLVDDRGKPLEKVNARFSAMNRAFPEAEIRDFDHLIDQLVLPDPDDRHVFAAAIVGAVDIIITDNLRDFPSEILGKHAIEAITADDFLVSMQAQYPQVGKMLTYRRAALLTRPQIGIDGILRALDCAGASKYANSLRKILFL